MNTKTLLYLASGQIYEDYRRLPFKKMICVDRQIQDINFQDNRFDFICSDALIAIEQLRNSNTKIDYLVNINDGILGGGGDYPILSDFMLGFLSPILSDEFFLIFDPAYYGSLRIKIKPEWGFNKSIVQIDDEAYVYPSFFSYSQRANNLIYNPSFGKVFRMNKTRKEKKIKIREDLESSLIYASIWDDEKKLDLMGINLTSTYTIPLLNRRSLRINDFFIQKGVYNLNQKSIQDVIKYANFKGHKHLGLSPWMNGEYTEVINYLRNCELGCVKSIRFYHLRKKDFPQLYNI